MGTSRLLFALTLIPLSLLVSSAALGGGEPTLQETLDDLGFGIDVETDALCEEEFLVVGDQAHVEVLAQIAGLANVTGVAWQTHKPIVMGDVLITPEIGGIVGQTADFFVPGGHPFEMLITIEDYHWWHTITEMNADGLQHARVFPAIMADGETVMNAFVFAWEDRWNLGDKDFQDIIFTVDDIGIVPEPTTLALFGMLAGMLGAAALRRR